MSYIYDNDAWDILIKYHNNCRHIINNYTLYYRSTKFSPENSWMEVKLNWVIKRKENLWECCFDNHLNHPNPFRRNYPWFAFNVDYGIYKLVLKPTLNFDI